MRTVEFVQAGDYAAEVSVELIEDERGWSPRLSLEDGQKLESVRLALASEDIVAAAKHARIFKLIRSRGGEAQ